MSNHITEQPDFITLHGSEKRVWIQQLDSPYEAFQLPIWIRMEGGGSRDWDRLVTVTFEDGVFKL